MVAERVPDGDPDRAQPAGRRRGRFWLVLGLLRAWRPTVARVRSLARSALTSFLVLAATLWLLPGVDSSGLVSMLWLVVLVAGVGTLLRPLLLALASVLGGYGALLLGFFIQAIVMYVALSLDPGAHISSFAMAFVASWVAAALSALVNYLADAGTDDAFLGETLRRMVRGRRLGGPRQPGLLVIQLDGVAAPLLQWAVRAGNLPNIGQWLRSGRYRLRSWHTGVPATTPAMQAGLLHGDAQRVPAFRWYEKDTRRLMVTNRPRDAAQIEERVSDGRGLLRHGGASIGNIFSGDAPVSLLTVSNAALPGRSARGYAAFMTSPYGLARAVVLGFGELLKELHQARLQRRRDVHPRVSRLGAYLLLRPVSNVLLRDLNVSLIAEQMARGTPTIFCDFVDYGEVAHHAGPARMDAMQALEELDRVVGILDRLAAAGGARDYRLVVLSDHGQSQGATFRQRHGKSLEQVVREQLSAPVPAHRTSAATGNVEEWGPVNMLLTGVAASGGPAAAATRAATRAIPRDVGGHEVVLGPAAADERAVEGTDPELVVVSSGNLAMVYLARYPGKLTLERLDELHPGLVRGLATHPGIGVVVVSTEGGGPVAIGARGANRLRDGVVTGEDPLAPYGPRARGDLLRHQAADHVGDLVLISQVDEGTDEVAAFEELVGCHGGLGGWQTEAMLVHPARWRIDTDELIGPEVIHRHLKRWRDELGLGPPAEVDADADAPKIPTILQETPGKADIST
jgi:hypothetical protein